MINAFHDTCHHVTYHLTCEQFERLVARANGVCEICGLSASATYNGKLCIDHDHRRGWRGVRGLVCPRCNAHLRRVDSGERQADGATVRYLRNAFHLDERQIAMPRRLWTRWGQAAATLGTTRSDMLREFADWYLREPNARLPKRPDTATPAIPEDLAD